jgi:hypothetical protein
MKNCTLIILLLLILTSCQNNEKKKIIVKTENKTKISLLYSELILDDKFVNRLFVDTITNKREAQFSPIHILEKLQIQLNLFIELQKLTIEHKIGENIKDQKRLI